jgi:hypothetical protein
MGKAKKIELARNDKGLKETLHSHLPSGGPSTLHVAGGEPLTDDLDAFRDEMQAMWEANEGRMKSLEKKVQGMHRDMSSTLGLIADKLGVQTPSGVVPRPNEAPRTLTSLAVVGKRDTFKGLSAGF